MVGDAGATVLPAGPRRRERDNSPDSLARGECSEGAAKTFTHMFEAQVPEDAQEREVRKPWGCKCNIS